MVNGLDVACACVAAISFLDACHCTMTQNNLVLSLYLDYDVIMISFCQRYKVLYLLVRRFYVCPIGSIYGIFAYMYHKNQPNVGRDTIHRSYGYFYFVGINYSSVAEMIRSHGWILLCKI